jgi:RNA polymerase sigma-70 factor (sigma-E family)
VREGPALHLVMTPREPSGTAARQDKVTETLVAATVLGRVKAEPRLDGSSGNGSQRLSDYFQPDTTDADTALATITEIYGAHYRSLVRLATLLVHDIATAEEVVQDSFVALHAGLHRLRDSDKTLSYLRAAVVNRSRSVLRHRVVVDRNAPKPAPDMPSAEHGALALIERSSVVAALRLLPDRQREVVVLRFYADMSEAQIAAAMGITRGAVKSHTSRAMAALRSVLERGT